MSTTNTPRGSATKITGEAASIWIPSWVLIFLGALVHQRHDLGEARVPRERERKGPIDARHRRNQWQRGRLH